MTKRSNRPATAADELGPMFVQRRQIAPRAAACIFVGSRWAGRPRPRRLTGLAQRRRRAPRRRDLVPISPMPPSLRVLRIGQAEARVDEAPRPARSSRPCRHPCGRAYLRLGGPRVGQPVVVVAPGDAVGVGEMLGVACRSRVGGCDGARSDRAVLGQGHSPSSISSRCRIFTALAPAFTYMSKTAGLQRFGQRADRPGLAEVVLGRRSRRPAAASAPGRRRRRSRPSPVRSMPRRRRVAEGHAVVGRAARDRRGRSRKPPSRATISLAMLRLRCRMVGSFR